MAKKSNNMRGLEKYDRRELARMVIDDLLRIRKEIVGGKRALADQHRTGQMNTLLKVLEMIGKIVGIDASLLTEKQRETLLEQVQAIFAKPSDQE